MNKQKSFPQLVEISVGNFVKIKEEMKFLKNKFFIIVLSIAIFVTVFTVTLSLMGVTDPIKDAVNSISVPFKYIVNLVSDSISGYMKYFSTIDSIDAENQALKDRLEELESLLVDADALKDENERLREYLEIKDQYPDFKLCEALIIGSEADNYSTVVTLNKGSNHGIEVGMPVIVKSGLVGSVCEVGNSWCRVRVISESSSGVGVCIARSGEIGIVEGDIALKDTGECYLRYLSSDADVEEGDLVYTSGIGGIYPEGLYVGRIKSVSIDKNLRTKTAVVSLAVDFEELKYLLVITGFEKNGD